MWGARGLGYVWLGYLVGTVTCAHLWDVSRQEPVQGYLPDRAVRPSLTGELPTPLQPITVQCQEAQMVVLVHRDLFGSGHLVQAADLDLGPQACSYTSLGASGQVIIFEVGLHECGSTLQVMVAVQRSLILCGHVGIWVPMWVNIY